MRRLLLITLLLPILWATASEAQLSRPEARSSGMATAYSARARGFESPYWNPANLGLADNPGWSVGLNASAYASNNALSYGQITDLYGEYLDREQKSRLLQDLRSATAGGLAEFSFDVGAQALAFSFGRFAAGLGGIGAGNAQLTPDAFELLLFGNVGESGGGRDFSFEGTEANLWNFYGGYASYAHPFHFDSLPMAGFSAGLTVRYGEIRDPFLVDDTNSQLVYSPLLLDVGIEKLDAPSGSGGSSWSADLGIAVEIDTRLVAGISLVNAFQSVNWNPENFELTNYQLTADYSDIAVTSTTLRYEELDPAVRERVDQTLEDTDLPRQLRFGALYRFTPRLDLSADYTEIFGGRLRSRWPHNLATGAEFRPAPWIPLRVGVATSFEQFGLTAGAGLHAGPVRVDASVGRWGLGGGDGLATALSVSYWPGM